MQLCSVVKADFGYFVIRQSPSPGHGVPNYDEPVWDGGFRPEQMVRTFDALGQYIE